jgi:hypothetical protein
MVSPEKSMRLSEKQTKTKRTGHMIKMEQHLPSKCEALNSNPIPPKKKKEVIFLIV